MQSDDKTQGDEAKKEPQILKLGDIELLMRSARKGKRKKKVVESLRSRRCFLRTIPISSELFQEALSDVQEKTPVSDNSSQASRQGYAESSGTHPEEAPAKGTLRQESSSVKKATQ
jgi:hypothetical protein